MNNHSMKENREFICFWLPPTYAPNYQTEKIEFFEEDNGFDQEEIKSIKEMDESDRIDLIDLIIIRFK